MTASHASHASQVVVEPVRKKVIPPPAAAISYAPTPAPSTAATAIRSSAAAASFAAPIEFAPAVADGSPVLAASSGAFNMDKMMERSALGGGGEWGGGDDLDLDLGDLGIPDTDAKSKKKPAAKKKPKKPKGLGATVIDDSAEL